MEIETSKSLIKQLEESKAVLHRMTQEMDPESSDCDALMTALASVDEHLREIRLASAA